MGKSVMGYFNTIQLAVCSNERQPWSSIVVEEEHGGDSYTLIWAVGSAGRQGAVAGFLCDNTTHLNFVWKLTTFLFFLLLFLRIIRQWYVLMMLIVMSIKIATLILPESIFLSTELLTLTYIIVRFSFQLQPEEHIITSQNCMHCLNCYRKTKVLFRPINRVNWSKCHNFVLLTLITGSNSNSVCARENHSLVQQSTYIDW